MNTKFTKGPWQILPPEKDKEYLRIRGSIPGGRYKVANVIDLKYHHDGSKWCEFERIESEANANLIACAPDMYEMLDSLKEDYPLSHPASMEIEQLLKRARGEHE